MTHATFLVPAKAQFLCRPTTTLPGIRRAAPCDRATRRGSECGRPFQQASLAPRKPSRPTARTRCPLGSSIRTLLATDTSRVKAVANVASRYPDLSYLGEYPMLEKRISQLAEGDQAWLKMVKDDGRIHGVTNPMGTTTSSAAHMAPNLGLVVSSKKPFGKESRTRVRSLQLPQLCLAPTLFCARSRSFALRQGRSVVPHDRVAGRGFALSAVRLAQAGFGHAGRVVGKGTRGTTNMPTT
jgi:hypothetical protein